MLDQVCLSCKGPLLLGDRIVTARMDEEDGKVHEGCFDSEKMDILQDGKPGAGIPDPNPVIALDPVPLTCEDALAKWDAGESLFTVEMGGLGPGYEQAIHIVAMELVRYLTTIVELPIVEDPKNKVILHHMRGILAIEGEKVGGMSGAQEDAAINLAFVTKRKGWREAVRAAPVDRRIQVCRFFPAGAR